MNSRKGLRLSSSPTAAKNESDVPGPTPVREAQLDYAAQKELNKKIKKLERQVADCEEQIGQTESAMCHSRG